MTFFFGYIKFVDLKHYFFMARVLRQGHKAMCVLPCAATMTPDNPKKKKNVFND